MRGAALPALGLVAAGILLSPPHQAEIRGFAFRPARVEVRVGERVVWTNADPVPHTATAMDGAWDTGELARGASAGVRFTEAGVYPYICAYHPQMRGEVTVTE